MFKIDVPPIWMKFSVKSFISKRQYRTKQPVLQWTCYLEQNTRKFEEKWKFEYFQTSWNTAIWIISLIQIYKILVDLSAIKCDPRPSTLDLCQWFVPSCRSQLFIPASSSSIKNSLKAKKKTVNQKLCYELGL